MMIRFDKRRFALKVENWRVPSVMPDLNDAAQQVPSCHERQLLYTIT